MDQKDKDHDVESKKALIKDLSKELMNQLVRQRSEIRQKRESAIFALIGIFIGILTNLIIWSIVTLYKIDPSSMLSYSIFLISLLAGLLIYYIYFLGKRHEKLGNIMANTEDLVLFTKALSEYYEAEFREKFKK